MRSEPWSMMAPKEKMREQLRPVGGGAPPATEVVPPGAWQVKLFFHQAPRDLRS